METGKASGFPLEPVGRAPGVRGYCSHYLSHGGGGKCLGWLAFGQFVLASDTRSSMLDSKLDQVDNEAFVDGGFVANTPIMKAARFWSMVEVFFVTNSFC